jgi:hypothetical protein
MFRHRFFTGSTLRNILGAALVASVAMQAQAALAQSANRAIPAGLQDARKAWAAAVQKSDGTAAATLAVLPLQYLGYQAPKTVQRAFYLREVSNWSTLKACLASEPIKPDRTQRRLGTHSFNCDGHGFFFAQKDGVWRHTGYENSNE